MHAQPHTTTEQKPGVPLEAIEFELALKSLDIVESGFEAALRRAVEKTDAQFLFDMPAREISDCQRIAAIGLGSGDDRCTLLVLLEEDGRTFRIEGADASDNPFAGMALSYRGILERLESLKPAA